MKRYLVRDLKKKVYGVLDGGPFQEFGAKDSERFEVIYEFDDKPFPNLTCQDCGIIAEDVKDRTYGSGVQCFACYKDDKDFEDEYR